MGKFDVLKNKEWDLIEPLIPYRVATALGGIYIKDINGHPNPENSNV